MLGKGAAVGSHRRWGRPPEPRPPLAEADRAGPLGRLSPPPSCTGLVGAPPVGRGGGKAGVTPHGANGGGALGSGTAANRRPAAAKGHRTTPAEEGRGASPPPSPPSPGSATPPPFARVRRGAQGEGSFGLVVPGRLAACVRRQGLWLPPGGGERGPHMVSISFRPPHAPNFIRPAQPPFPGPRWAEGGRHGGGLAAPGPPATAAAATVPLLPADSGSPPMRVEGHVGERAGGGGKGGAGRWPPRRRHSAQSHVWEWLVPSPAPPPPTSFAHKQQCLWGSVSWPFRIWWRGLGTGEKGGVGASAGWARPPGCGASLPGVSPLPCPAQRCAG